MTVLQLRQHKSLSSLLAAIVAAIVAQLRRLTLYLLDRQGDMVERGMIIVAIVAVTLVIWFTIGDRIAAALSNVASQL